MSIQLSHEEHCALLRSPLLVGAEAPLLSQILASPAASTLSFVPGQAVYTPQRFQRCLGILLSGTLCVRQDRLAVSTLTASDLFGAAALYNSEASYATTLTGGEEGRILLLEFQLVDDLIATAPLLRENYLRYLTGRIRFLSRRLHSVAAGDGEGKLARYLLSTEGDITCSATELAQRLGMGRATLYRAFQTLEDAQAISRTHRTITVINPAALSQYA